jgi:hypothetical protein
MPLTKTLLSSGFPIAAAAPEILWLPKDRQQAIIMAWEVLRTSGAFIIDGVPTKVPTTLRKPPHGA